MAKGKKTGGRNFKKGEVSNPLGRPKVDPAIREIRNYNKAEIERLFNEFMNVTLSELVAILRDKSRTVIELMVAKVISESIRRGDQVRFNFLLDRMVGKVVDRMDASFNSTLEALINQTQIKLPPMPATPTLDPDGASVV